MLRFVLVVIFVLSGLTTVSAQSPVKPALIVKAEGSGYSVGNNGGDIWLAQSFKVTKAGMLTEFSVTLGENTGFPNGTITYQLRSDVKNLPGNEILAEGDFEPEPEANNVVLVDDVPILAIGHTYWLVLMATDPQWNQDYWTWQVSPKSVYAGGRLLYSGDEGYSWNDDDIDAQFSITTDGTR